jgi:hypothetical protein
MAILISVGYMTVAGRELQTVTGQRLLINLLTCF